MSTWPIGTVVFLDAKPPFEDERGHYVTKSLVYFESGSARECVTLDTVGDVLAEFCTAPAYLTTTQLAEAVGVTRNAIIKAIHRGTLAASKVGRDYQIKQEAAREWVLRRTQK